MEVVGWVGSNVFFFSILDGANVEFNLTSNII